jgi:hypothetical protein
MLGNSSVTSTQTFGTFKCGGSVYTAPSVQGAYMGWNRLGSSGATTFANQQGSGAGGFEWVNYNSLNTLTTPNPLMTLDSSGNLTVAGNIISTSNPCFGSASFNRSTTGAVIITIPLFGTYYNSGGAVFSSLGYNTSISGTTITVPTAGYYRIDYRLRFLGASTAFQSIIQVNGTSSPTLQTTLNNLSTGQVGDMLATTTLNLGAGDIISFPMLTMKSGANAQNIYLSEGHFEVTRRNI